jgi:hypothetical protein
MNANEKMLQDLKESTAALHQARLDLRAADERLQKNFIGREKVFSKRA